MLEQRAIGRPKRGAGAAVLVPLQERQRLKLLARLTLKELVLGVGPPRGDLAIPEGGHRLSCRSAKAGLIWARLMAEGKAKGRPRSTLDTIIAAIAEANECVVVTDNEKRFIDIEIVNPVI